MHANVNDAFQNLEEIISFFVILSERFVCLSAVILWFIVMVLFVCCNIFLFASSCMDQIIDDY